VPAKPCQAMPTLALPCPAKPALPHLAKPCPAPPCLPSPAGPRRAIPSRACPARPRPTTPSRATPARPRRAIPRHAGPNPACPVGSCVALVYTPDGASGASGALRSGAWRGPPTSYRRGPSFACLASPSPALPGLALPRLPSPATPSHAKPRHATPSLAAPALPSPAQPYPAMPSHAVPAAPRRAPPSHALPAVYETRCRGSNPGRLLCRQLPSRSVTSRCFLSLRGSRRSGPAYGCCSGSGRTAAPLAGYASVPDTAGPRCPVASHTTGSGTGSASDRAPSCPSRSPPCRRGSCRR
jgi:hypothetical protein